MKIYGIIPARYESSRLLGKPLADICGKPMIWWVYQRAKKVPELDEVYIATDDERVIAAVDGFGGKAIMTSDKHPTGSDRSSEVVEDLDADLYVVIQGDEPLIEPKNISCAIQAKLKHNDASCTILKSPFKNPVDVVNSTTPKIVCDVNGFALLITRSPVPYPHRSLDFCYYKPLGIYVFSQDTLKVFKQLKRGFLESAEDSEILRLIEHGYKVYVQEVKSQSIAVDTEKDLKRVRELISSGEV